MKGIICKNLTFYRTRKGLTRTEAAAKIDVSRVAISQYELGKTNPSVLNLVKLCKLYECSMDDMLADIKDAPKSIYNFKAEEFIKYINKYHWDRKYKIIEKLTEGLSKKQRKIVGNYLLEIGVRRKGAGRKFIY